jgi:hypothetical protein
MVTQDLHSFHEEDRTIFWGLVFSLHHLEILPIYYGSPLYIFIARKYLGLYQRGQK